MGFFDIDAYSRPYSEDKRSAKNSNPRHIRGISCDVSDCVYHDGENYCTADKIAIGPSYAKSCTDTICATFKQRTL